MLLMGSSCRYPQFSEIGVAVCFHFFPFLFLSFFTDFILNPIGCIDFTSYQVYSVCAIHLIRCKITPQAVKGRKYWNEEL